MNRQEVEKLLDKYLQGKATPQEEALVQYWLTKESGKRKEIQEDLHYPEIHSEMWQVISAAIPGRKIRTWPRVAAAAAIILMIGTGIFYFKQKNIETQNIISKNEILPGGNKAYLTLGNGQRISLTDAKNGTIADQAGQTITKTADGKVVYVVGHTNHNAITYEYNTIETPRGGQYQVTLPDGTEVWLNASSSLKYPASFASLKERKVELTGEGYFQVAKDKAHPFIVKTDQQELKVLGTHFNVNSYADEQVTKTTLLEGSVRVSPLSPQGVSLPEGERYSVVLKPNQEAILNPSGRESAAREGRIKVQSADTELAVAWKNNQFMFDDESIQHIMKMVERWYDVEVIYKGPIPNYKFGGAVSRFENVSEVLRILETTRKVHFRIEGKKIYVFK